MQCYNGIVGRDLNIFEKENNYEKDFYYHCNGRHTYSNNRLRKTDSGITSDNNKTTTKAIVTTTAVTTAENTSTTSAKVDNKKTESSGTSTTAVSEENTVASPVTKTDHMQIAGVWYEENVLDSRTLTIDGDGTYNANVKWSSSAADGSAWTYICTYDAENDAVVCSGSGVNVDYFYTENGQSSYTENYNNGSAMFYTDNNGNLLWLDYYTNVADEMVFTRC